MNAQRPDGTMSSTVAPPAPTRAVDRLRVRAPIVLAVLAALAAGLSPRAAAAQEPEPAEEQTQEPEPAEEQTQEPEPAPDRWRLDLGLTMNSTGGNQDLTVLTSEVGLTHLETSRYEMDLGVRFRYGHSEGERVAENLRGTLSLDLNPDRGWSPFLFATAERDPFRRLDLRLNGGSGLKRTFWKDDWDEVSMSAAILYSEERLDLVEPDAERLTRNARWSWRGRVRRSLGQGRRAEHVTFYQPVWDRGGDYLLESRTSLRFSLTEHLSLNSSVLLERDSTPPPDVDPNDWTVSVGLGIATRW